MNRFSYVVPLLLLIGQAASAQTGDMEWIRWPSNFAVADLKVSSDGRYLLSTGFYDTAASVTEVETGDVVRTVTLATQGVFSANVEFSADNRSIVGAVNQSFGIWDIETGERSGLVPSDTRNVSAFGVSTDAQFLASGGYNATSKPIIIIRRVSGGDTVSTSIAAVDNPVCSSFSRDNSVVAVANYGPMIWVINVSTGIVLNTFGSTFQKVWLSPDGSYLITIAGRVIQLWDVSTGEVVRRFLGHSADVGDVAFDSSGRYLASASGDGTVRIWETSSGQLLHTYSDYPGTFTTVAFLPDGRHIVSGTVDGAVILWKTRYTSSVDDRQAVSDITLSGAQPNPVADKTTIDFSIVDAGQVRLDIFNLLGEHVTTLAEGPFEAGSHRVVWNASEQPIGRYYCRLTREGKSRVVGVTVSR